MEFKDPGPEPPITCGLTGDIGGESDGGETGGEVKIEVGDETKIPALVI
jgi:hypothetical protein